ncbi:hypothetical protein LCGC14_0450120 [marine sediment metagenome]|uniref:BRCT domain-containing protein n=1 Tax=marine sediment metagenome TaxID=412755 RepID=A0A0F9V4W7_9ZZZZ|nr:hypothetical protein [Phycisphaerae bacterium]HDZ43355.1 hypothetical protein [Phycisphaerae bacterium]
MARAVAQRRQVPYVLITFVFLFLIAAIFAVVWRMEADEEAQLRLAAEKKLDKLADSDGLNLAEVIRMINEFDSPRVGKQPLRVLGQYRDQISQLVQLITGDETQSFADALASGNSTRKKHNSTLGLTATIDGAYEQIAARDRLVLQNKRDFTLQSEQLNSQLQTQSTKLDDFRSLIKDRDAQVTQLKERLGTYRSEHTDILDEVRSDFDTQRSNLNDKVAVLTQQLASSQASVKRKNNEVAQLRRRLAELTGRKVAQGVVFNPDGKVAEVVSAEVIYINIGKDNKVIPGLTFSVFPPTGKQEERKGNLLVTKVLANTSECKIIELVDTQHPMTSGDMIMNIAFSEERPYTFVVRGLFDLHGMDRPNAEGGDEVRAMIKRFKGVVIDEVSPQVDFVVMGEEPRRPPTPSDEIDDPTVWKVYEQNMKLYKDYLKILRDADALSIPILNSNRFMDLIGYKPVQTLEY